ncbi:phage holin family protein [Tateyamaria omphalii]|uniref:phage holin family protein n=1 Tax=Tateyamaria omphalii TaxID=299262 RepID=UPI001C9904A1|nr:phage holin family protein [Tateyamaria omphalii]MBY5933472.1 phage holin family protein [Tateyamaria omphalii]
MLTQIKQNVAQTAQRAALGGLGGICLLAGVGFLTAALFMYLLTQTDPITACLIIGGGFSGLGLVFVGLSRTGKSSPPAAVATAQASPSASAMTPVMLAFLDGLQQGMAARQAAKPGRPN